MRRKTTIHLPPKSDPCLYHDPLEVDCSCVNRATNAEMVRDRARADLVSQHFKNGGTVAELKDVLDKFNNQ